MKTHATLSEEFNRDESYVDWHDKSLWTVRSRRDAITHKIPDWEELRTSASNIKMHTLSKLGYYLSQFEEQATKNGICVHWAQDAEEHNNIVYNILKEKNVKEIVKSKSILTEECELNHFLQSKGIDVVDSDLGELVVQLAHQIPSHIVLPCIHMTKESISDLFHDKLGTPKGNVDAKFLANVAREYLRDKFLTRKVAITGVNFMIAETGEFVVCTNEGNADMGVHIADTHIACVGIEKLLPLRKHLGVFLRLLARSATGQQITVYSSHFRKPAPQKEIHLILVDNGRTKILANPSYRNSLKCIRCGACFNTCPVYRRSGGFSYKNAVAGPIGSIISPNMDMKKHADLPFASSLCGSCSNVCPVKINIHEQLYLWRQDIVKSGYVSPVKKIMMQKMALMLSKPWLYKWAGKTARVALRNVSFIFKSKKLNPWYKHREMPNAPKQSFMEWYQKNK